MNRRSFLRGLLLAVPGVALLSRPSEPARYDEIVWDDIPVPTGGWRIEEWHERVGEVAYHEMRLIPPSSLR